MHAPSTLQLSERVVSHAAHIAPGAPQAPRPSVVQLLPVQQPFGHEEALQLHAPPTQACPAAQLAPEPHLQAPPVQLSARSGSQETHAVAPVPQLFSDGELQVDPLQQPLVQLLVQPEQTPPEQDWPPGQTSQPSPPVPHAPGAFPARHAPPEQQPVGHETPSQMHMPPWHR